MWVGTEMEKKIWFYYTDVRQCPTHKNLRYSISLIFTKIWFIFQQEGNYEKAKDIFNCRKFDKVEDADDERQELCEYYSNNIKKVKMFSEITKKNIFCSTLENIRIL